MEPAARKPIAAAERLAATSISAKAEADVILPPLGKRLRALRLDRQRSAEIEMFVDLASGIFYDYPEKHPIGALVDWQKVGELVRLLALAKTPVQSLVSPPPIMKQLDLKVFNA